MGQQLKPIGNIIIGSKKKKFKGFNFFGVKCVHILLSDVFHSRILINQFVWIYLLMLYVGKVITG